VLRIIHLNTYDVTGGAALATYRLHKGLCKLGCDSSMLVAHRSSNDPSVISLVPKMDITSRIRRRIRAEKITSRSRYKKMLFYDGFSDDRTIYADDLVSQLPPCDIINLHWIARFVDYQTFFSAVPSHVPLFWRLSDMNPLTGGCHFDDGCGKHSVGCGACPQLGSTDTNDLSRQIWRRKQEVFKGLRPDRLHFIAPSRWMAELVSGSPVFGRFRVTVIPNGVETDVFAPRDQQVARDVLGIPQSASVILFVSDGLHNRRKGYALLARALSQLDSCPDAFLLSVGRGSIELETQIPHCHVGQIENRRLLSLVYSAADVCVVPSLQDNQPNTVLEAMACGTPVVGFNVGGIPDMIRPGITGALTPAGDGKALRNAIVDLLSQPEKRAFMSASCRDLVMREYPLEVQIRRYLELYESSLATFKDTAETKLC
jgi:glycosyltransferase involved in cell wall biosynthesis